MRLASFLSGASDAAFGAAHRNLVLRRRARVLAGRLAGLLPREGTVLDVGCGDGAIAAAIMQQRPAVSVVGVDVLVRPDASIPVRGFDGRRLPFADDAFDAALLVDVLHHTDDPMALLREARRIARRSIVIKDHTCDGVLAWPTLRAMDRVCNARHGVRLPYNYWRADQWRDAFARLGLPVRHWDGRLRLYPWPASMVLDRDLHFAALLGVDRAADSSAGKVC
ncbi:MAG: class I SAM-dependent methyltransferase [Rhodospirillales bacterium]